MQLAFYFDQTKCTGCYTCAVACKDWNNISAGPANWRRVITIEKGDYPNLFVAYLSVSCYHCSEPACVSACPTEAIHKREQDGIVVVDRQICLGKDSCEICLQSCPYKSPQFGEEKNPKMQKCDFCLDRWAENKKPICVTGCPNRALDAGPIEEIRAAYGDIRAATGFSFYRSIRPSIIFRPKEFKSL